MGAGDEADGLAALRGASREEAVAFFVAADPEGLVRAVAATDDQELLALVARDEVRPAAVAGVLSRLDEFAIPERLAEVEGVVRFDLQRRGRLLERHAVEFADGTIRVLGGNGAGVGEELAGGRRPDVVLTTSVLRFVRLVSGERNAGLEYLSGKLDIDGDAMLALAVGGIFRVPGSGQVAVDPTLLDPVDVATALGQVSADHLRKVMTGGFRGVVLDEVFRRLPDFVDPAKAATARLSVGLRLLGNPTGEVERYVVDVVDGAATVHPGEAGGTRDATVTMQGHDFLRLATGHLNPVAGVLKGQLKVKGDKARALQLTSLLDIPQPR